MFWKTEGGDGHGNDCDDIVMRIVYAVWGRRGRGVYMR